MVIKHLSMATLEENIQSEEDFDDYLDKVLRDKELLLETKNKLLETQDKLLETQEKLLLEKEQNIQNIKKRNDDLLRYIAELEKKIKKD